MARIRELNQDDVPRVAEILAQSQPWASAGDSVQDLEKLLLPSRGWGEQYVAESDGTPAGVVGFISEPVFARGGCVLFLAVRDEMRRRGIGRQLMGFVERKIFTQSSNIYVSVSSCNRPACCFFERLGYLKVGEIPDLLVPGTSEWILRKSTPKPRRGGSE